MDVGINNQVTVLADSAIEADSKVPFVLYWGKGPRSYACSTEASCLDFLSTLAWRVKQVYPRGVVFDLVFTDTHARLNGHSERSMEYYFHDVAACADPDLFRSHRLSNLVFDREHETETLEKPSPEMLDELEKSACKWFGGRATPRQAAATYFAMNMRERRAIETEFPNSVFITFNGSKLRPLFPTRLPIFYMHSIKKGVSVKPWFMPDPDETQPFAFTVEVHQDVLAVGTPRGMVAAPAPHLR